MTGTGDPGQVTRGQVTQEQVTRGQVTQGMVTRGQVTRGQVTQGQVTQGQVTRGQVLLRNFDETLTKLPYMSNLCCRHGPCVEALTKLLRNFGWFCGRLECFVRGQVTQGQMTTGRAPLPLRPERGINNKILRTMYRFILAAATGARI